MIAHGLQGMCVLILTACYHDLISTVTHLDQSDRAVEVLAMEMATDISSTFDESSCIKMVGRVALLCAHS